MFFINEIHTPRTIQRGNNKNYSTVQSIHRSSHGCQRSYDTRPFFIPPKGYYTHRPFYTLKIWPTIITANYPLQVYRPPKQSEHRTVNMHVLIGAQNLLSSSKSAKLIFVLEYSNSWSETCFAHFTSPFSYCRKFLIILPLSHYYWSHFDFWYLFLLLGYKLPPSVKRIGLTTINQKIFFHLFSFSFLAL